jgi:hypothetical protein
MFSKFNSKFLIKKFTTKEDEILIFTHQQARKYYKMNVPFLAGYLVISYNLIKHPDYPSYLKNTSMLFSSIIFLALIGINIYANRHISMIKLRRHSQMLNIETFSKFGFGKKNYIIPLNDVKEITSIKKYIKTKKTGIFIIKTNKKVFNFFNFFFIRPSRNNPEFDKIFKKILK